MPTRWSRAAFGSGRYSGSRLLAAAVVLPVIVLAGCTSVTRTTLVQAGSTAGPADGSTGLVDGSTQGGTSGGSAATTTSGGLIGGGSSTSGAGSTGAGTSGGATAGGAASTSGGAAASTCKTPVKIGVAHSSDQGKAGAAYTVGGGEIDQSAIDAYDNAGKQGNTTMVSWVNAHGGFAGCPGVVSFYDFKLLAPDGPAAETQRMCTAFGQDQKVNIVYSAYQETSALIPCLAKRGIVTFFDGIRYTPSPTDFKKYRGLLYQSRAITPYRWQPFIPLLSRYGYFAVDAQGNKTGSPTVGILLDDLGDGHNQYLVNKLWVPALNKLGIKSVVYTYTSSNSDPTGAYNAAVVQFKRNNVTHVMLTPDGGYAVNLFTQSAEAQMFRPRYALTTINCASCFAVLTQQGQRNNSMLVSIDPYVDVSPPPARSANDAANRGSLAQFNSNGRSPNAALCDQIFKGRIPPRSAMITMYPICDRYLELRAALARQTSFSKQTLLAGMNAVSHAPAVGYANRTFSAPHHYDGARAVRVAQWQESNTSFIYKSPKLPIPRVEG